MKPKPLSEISLVDTTDEYKKISYKIISVNAQGKEVEIGFALPYESGDIECSIYQGVEIQTCQKSNLPGYAEVFFLRKREDDE